MVSEDYPIIFARVTDIFNKAKKRNFSKPKPKPAHGGRRNIEDEREQKIT